MNGKTKSEKQMRVRKLVMCAGLMVFAGAASAAQWHTYTSANDSHVDSYDAQTMTVHGPIVTVWVKSVITPPDRVNGVTIASAKSHWDINCANRTYGPRQVFLFSDTDTQNMVAQERAPTVSFVEIPPESRVEELSNIVCKGRK